MSEGGARAPKSRLEAIGAHYRTLAVHLLGIGLLLLALNLLAIPLVRWLEPGPGSLRYDMDDLLASYPGWTEQELRRLLEESWRREYTYRPFVQHVESYHAGRYVNILPPGMRSLGEDQGPWPPRRGEAVLVLGGSTTFGYGLPDHETLPASLQRRLRSSCEAPLSVYNFGHGNYYSVQERVLLMELLLAGTEPRAVVFVDGINEWKERPKFTARLEYLMSERPVQLTYRALRELPLARLLRQLRPKRAEEADGADTDVEPTADRYVGRWLDNRRLTKAAADALGFPVLFVWQPSPSYRYDLDHHPFVDAAAKRSWGERLTAAGYRRLDAARGSAAAGLEGEDFLWLGDLQVGRQEPLYVDRVHYTAAFAAEIADRVAGRLVELLECR